MLDTRLIERANIIGGPEGVLLALGPDLTVGEWANRLGMSPGEVRAACASLGVEPACADLTEAAQEALRALAFGDMTEARRVLRIALSAMP